MLPLRFLLLAMSWLVLATQGLAAPQLYESPRSYESPPQGRPLSLGDAVSDDSVAQAPGTEADTDAWLESVPSPRPVLLKGEESDGSLASGAERDDIERDAVSLTRALLRTFGAQVFLNARTDRPHSRERLLAQARAPPVLVGLSS